MNNKENGRASQTTHSSRSEITRRLVGIAVFSALAFAMSLATSWIKISGFLSLDIKDAVITIGAFVYGPLSVLPMSIITVILEAVTVGSTGPIGALMDFASTCAFALTVSLIYKYKRNMTGAVMGFAIATVAYLSVMMPLNLLLTPIYQGVPYEAVKGMILPLLLPFNLGKALVNSSVAMLLYKPLSLAMRKAGLLKSGGSMKLGRGTLIITLIAVLTLAAAVAIFIIIN